jgi:zinc and cadmium transporter
MGTEIIYTFVSVIFVTLVSLIGLITISVSVSKIRKIVFLFVALAVGALLGDAFIHLIPEAFESSLSMPTVSLLILLGIFVFFLLEALLSWQHSHGHDVEYEDVETVSGREVHVHGSVKPLGSLIVVSDGIHNFLDGIIIAVSFTASIEVGIATTIAVILHEIPQEIGDFGVLLHAGYTRARALLINAISGALAIVGAAAAIIFSTYISGIEEIIVPVAAGAFIYIAVADLLPELHKRARPKRFAIELITILIGISAMYALLFV